MPSDARCQVDGCDNPKYLKGWCSAHYQRWRKHGDPLMGRPTSAPKGAPQAFIEEAVKHVGDDCLLWPYGRDTGGYGSINLPNRKKANAHRLICTRVHGEPPTAEHQAAHICGVRACCNPSHLRWATVAENQADRLIHGTDHRGEKHHQAKLTESDVLEIRTLLDEETISQVARRYGVHIATISAIKHRKIWPWLEGGH